MDLSKILTVSGKPGLFELIAQSKNNSVVQDLITGKKTTIAPRLKVSILSNIAIFTETDDVSLEDVLEKINQKENGNPCIFYKEEPEDLKMYFESVLPNYDKTRVKLSDIKKIMQWYSIFQESGRLDKIEVKAKAPKKEKAAKQKNNGEESGAAE